MALKDIRGCQGGDNGEEITVDYHQALNVNGLCVKGDKE